MEKLIYESRPYILTLMAVALPLTRGSHSPILLGSCAILLFTSLYVIKLRLEHRALEVARKPRA